MRFLFLLLLLLPSFAAQEAEIKRESVCDCVTKETVIVDVSTQEGRIIKVLADSGYSIGMQQILLAQAKFESGSFKNTLSKKWNNVYSMLHSRHDPYSKGNWGFAEGRSGYAVYNSLEESVYARLWYSRKWKYPSDVASVDEYVLHIKSKGYFTGSTESYISNMRSLIKADAHIFENKSVMIACNSEVN